MVLAASLLMCLHHPLPSLPAAFHGSSSIVKWVKNSQKSQTLLLCTSLAPRNEINMSANRCYFRERGKRFQFTIISSNKNKKIGSSLPNCLGKSLASISRPIITPQLSDFCGVILGHIEKAQILSVICTAVKG